jgi:hypothetical protein
MAAGYEMHPGVFWGSAPRPAFARGLAPVQHSLAFCGHLPGGESASVGRQASRQADGDWLLRWLARGLWYNIIRAIFA